MIDEDSERYVIDRCVSVVTRYDNEELSAVTGVVMPGVVVKGARMDGWWV